MSRSGRLYLAAISNNITCRKRKVSFNLMGTSMRNTLWEDRLQYILLGSRSRPLWLKLLLEEGGEEERGGRRGLATLSAAYLRHPIEFIVTSNLANYEHLPFYDLHRDRAFSCSIYLHMLWCSDFLLSLHERTCKPIIVCMINKIAYNERS